MPLIIRNDRTNFVEVGQCFYDAAEEGNVNQVRLYLAHHWDVVNWSDDDGDTALHIAANKGHADVVQVLLANEADPNTISRGGCTPLQWAAQYGHCDCLTQLLQSGADANAADTIGGYTPLHYAVAYTGNEACVSQLLRHGADVYAKNTDGATPLHDAAATGHVNYARLLLSSNTDQKTDINRMLLSVDDQGRTPQDVAMESGFHDLANTLEFFECDNNRKHVHEGVLMVCGFDIAGKAAFIKNTLQNLRPSEQAGNDIVQSELVNNRNCSAAPVHNSQQKKTTHEQDGTTGMPCALNIAVRRHASVFPQESKLIDENRFEKTAYNCNTLHDDVTRTAEPEQIPYVAQRGTMTSALVCEQSCTGHVTSPQRLSSDVQHAKAIGTAMIRVLSIPLANKKQWTVIEIPGCVERYVEVQWTNSLSGAIFAVVCDGQLKWEEQEQHVEYWLKYISTRMVERRSRHATRGDNRRLAQVLLIINRKEAKVSSWKRNSIRWHRTVRLFQQRFGSVLNIDSNVWMIDCEVHHPSFCEHLRELRKVALPQISLLNVNVQHVLIRCRTAFGTMSSWVAIVGFLANTFDDVPMTLARMEEDGLILIFAFEDEIDNVVILDLEWFSVQVVEKVLASDNVGLMDMDSCRDLITDVNIDTEGGAVPEEFLESVMRIISEKLYLGIPVDGSVVEKPPGQSYLLVPTIRDIPRRLTHCTQAIFVHGRRLHCGQSCFLIPSGFLPGCIFGCSLHFTKKTGR
eukprot:m.412441 g.412441  ORF g.412441 m.412441 type:complete len:744 (+) comp21256_c0_seq1:192-2423(+)